MNQEIKERIEKIKRGEVPEGYKTTKSGTIPLHWDSIKLRRLAIPIKEKAQNRELEVLSITAGVGFVNQAEKFGKEIAGAQYQNYTVLHKGDFSYNKGNSKTYPQGCIYMLEDRTKAAVPNVFNSFRFITGVHTYYYKHLFINGFLNKQLHKYINAGVRNDGLLNLYDDDFFNCELPVLPLPEQERIAEILSTWDKAIGLLENLIEQKKKQKKLLVIQFFQSQDSNNFVNLGSVCFVTMGQSPNSSNYNYECKGKPLIQGNADINRRKAKPRMWTTEITKECKPGDLLLSVRAPVGMVAKSDITACIGRGMCALTPKIESEYIYQFLLFYEDKWDGIAQGSTFSAINKNDINKIKLPVPKENGKINFIANILSTADKEIDLLEQKLEQLQKQKKALMQLLLTGIVRVTVNSLEGR